MPSSSSLLRLHFFATGVLLAVLLAFGTGCGALAAAANPKVAWALNDPAPMTVVVRRADAADKTSKEVDRLLTATPASPDSDWMGKTGPLPADAASQMKALMQEPMYATSKARVVPAEVWIRSFAALSSAQGTYPNLLAAVDKDLGDKYQKIMEKKVEVAGLRALIAEEEAALADKNLAEADKREHADSKAKLEKMVDASEKDLEPMQKAFIGAAKAAAGKAPPDVRDKFGVAFVNLRQAVDDAEIANGAAAVRYPLAVTTMLDSIKAMVPVFVADIVEGKTGKRPTTLQTLQPDVKLDGMSVALTLNGLTEKDLGKLKLADLTSETLDRTQKWVKHAIGLLGTVAATKEVLSFEEDVLDAVLGGFASGGWKAMAAAKIPAMDAPEVASASPAKAGRPVAKADPLSVTSAKGKAAPAAAGKGTSKAPPPKAATAAAPAAAPPPSAPAAAPAAATAPAAAKVVKPAAPAPAPAAAPAAATAEVFNP
jgi:hypothetical protein